MNENYNQLDKELNHLVQIIARLRAEDGCPWDREQTHGSLKAACVEEAAEVVGGINILEQTGNAENLKEELGDLLLQVVMHAQIAKEEELFTLEDVIRGISEKMIRRKVQRTAKKVRHHAKHLTPSFKVRCLFTLYRFLHKHQKMTPVDDIYWQKQGYNTGTPWKTQ